MNINKYKHKFEKSVFNCLLDREVIEKEKEPTYFRCQIIDKEDYKVLCGCCNKEEIILYLTYTCQNCKATVNHIYSDLDLARFHITVENYI